MSTFISATLPTINQGLRHWTSSATSQLQQRISHIGVRCIHTHVWRTGNDFPERALERLRHKENLGIAFSGGGTRSATACIGQLSALTELGVIDKARYISAVSGGGWMTAPYTFLPAHIEDQTFFGTFEQNPNALTLKRLDELAQNSFGHAISRTFIADKYILETLKGSHDKTFSRALEHLFLKTFDLGDRSRSFTYNDETLSLADRSIDYYTTKENRPFLILGVIMFTEKFGKIPLEFTSHYLGVRSQFLDSAQSFGGNYVSAYSYDSKAPENSFPEDQDTLQTDVSVDTKRGALTLADIIGSTGAAPQEILHKMGLSHVGFPEFEYWGLQPDQISFTPTRKIPHGDGGSLENLGVMPLFARQVERVIVFVNSMEPLKYNEQDKELSLAAASLKPLFAPIPNKEHEGDFDHNVALEGGIDKYYELLYNLDQKKQEGKTALYTDTYTVKKNHLYGINQSYPAKITWVYNERVTDWESQLPAAVRKKIGAHSGEFARFPHYRTFFETFPEIIKLSNRQVNLLSHLAYWNVKSHQEEFC